jgi:hypothetical protein
VTHILALAAALLLSACGTQQRVTEDATEREVKAGHALFIKVWDETGDPFEARRQVLMKHVVVFADPKWSRMLDQMTALAWASQGGDAAGAECYIRGFQFGTAHHDQCVYEVKMENGRRAAGQR